ncbi:phage tail protein [Yersinia ruckeri]|uniref:phage tail protein n=1 Tax=Yersinia ruckeri TaxID=29486 RepID=UPI002264BA13|nr:phage tail protein [Yersinia ruckeri]UZX55220.1 phage tail protein [Yersinia ruckeri]
MTARFYALLTHVGAAKLANATALGTLLDITQMAVGDGGGALPAPNPAQTQLIGEKRRAALNALSIDPVNTSQIIAEQVIPENEGGWWIREIGLYDSAGDLVAIANCAETYKPQLQEGSGRTQTIRMILIVSSTEAVTLKIDPSVVLATRKYVDDKVIEVKQYADNVLAEHEKSRHHPDATLSEKGFVTLSNATDSNSETEAATPRAVKAAANASVTALSDHVRSANPHDQYLQVHEHSALAVNKNAALNDLAGIPPQQLPVGMGLHAGGHFWDKFDIEMIPVASGVAPETRAPIVRELLQYMGMDRLHFHGAFNIMKVTIKKTIDGFGPYAFHIPSQHIPTGCFMSFVLYYKIIGGADWSWCHNEVKGRWHQHTHHLFSGNAAGNYSHVDIGVAGNPAVGDVLYLALPQIIPGRWNPDHRCPQLFNLGLGEAIRTQ